MLCVDLCCMTGALRYLFMYACNGSNWQIFGEFKRIHKYP